MKENFIYILTFLYGIGGIVTISGFTPTIIDLLKKKPSANPTTYAVWTTTTFISSLYGYFVLQNLLFNIIINLQFLACFTILILRLRLNYIKK